MLAACLLLACAIIGGTLLTFWFDIGTPRAARFCLGACLGLPLLSSVGFAISLWLGLGPASIAISAVILLLPLLLLLSADRRARIFSLFGGSSFGRSSFGRSSRGARRTSGGNLGYLLFYVAIAILLGLFFNRAVFETSDGIFTGIANNLGDMPLHLQIINSFSQGHNLPPRTLLLPECVLLILF